MRHEHRHLLGAFAAMLFVGASWGANLPVTKVMLRYFDLLPLAAMRTIAATAALALLLWIVEGSRTLRIDLGPVRFLSLGFMMSSFFAIYALGIYYSNPISAAAVQVAGPLVSALTVRLVTGTRFDPGFGVALGLTLLGGVILSTSSLVGTGPVSLGGGELIVLLSNALWALYSIKAQAWFERASQLHRAYVASLSAMGWLTVISLVLVALGAARSPSGISDGWVWTQLLVVAVLASGLGGYFWNIGASRLGVAIASLWVNLVPFFAVLWSMAYGYWPNGYQIVGGLVALTGVVYMQWRKLQIMNAIPR
ncbi:EamA-like transporter family protein [Enhydrobacter aerosaccus]|uniref:EamA-like transporter family protein n=1 Tax=Enhydrobacter aerosaccus TaxID=225324 RepID=A0A1T4JS61_9HYPH|nr:DMT family transporter [Enhydrobacter aerosaccus]SJZ33042.1 EamA-like transporter family protein [Enhydrobacter aerosaccus]